MWQAEILTLFPAMVTGYLEASILGKARARGLVRVEPRDIREHAEGKHRVTDDAPYGGGAGMVMKPEPLVAAIEAARAALPGARVLLTSPRGRALHPGAWRGTWPQGRRISSWWPGATRAWTSGSGATSTARSRSATSSSPAASSPRCASWTRWRACSPASWATPSRPAPRASRAGCSSIRTTPGPRSSAGWRSRRSSRAATTPGIARWRRWHQLQLTRARRPDLLEGAGLSDEDRRLLALDEKDL